LYRVEGGDSIACGDLNDGEALLDDFQDDPAALSATVNSTGTMMASPG
jgi:hypothetical protein